MGELCAGVLLGASVLAVLPAVSDWLLPRQPEQMCMLDAAGQFGVLLIVGVIGAELNFSASSAGTTVARVSIAGLVLPLGGGVRRSLIRHPPCGTARSRSI